MESSRGPTLVVASLSPIHLFPTTERLPRGWRKKLEGQLVLRAPCDIVFPNYHIEAGSLLAVSLPLVTVSSSLVVFRTATGSYGLGQVVDSEDIAQWPQDIHWILLPTNGLDITGVVEAVIEPKAGLGPEPAHP